MDIAHKILFTIYTSSLGDVIRQFGMEYHLYADDTELYMTYGDRAFYIAAPVLWNNLPTRIRLAKTLVTFKSLLKTYLFQQAYPEDV